MAQQHKQPDKRPSGTAHQCSLCGCHFAHEPIAGLRNGTHFAFCSTACESTSTADAGDGLPVAGRPDAGRPGVWKSCDHCGKRVRNHGEAFYVVTPGEPDRAYCCKQCAMEGEKPGGNKTQLERRLMQEIFRGWADGSRPPRISGCAKGRRDASCHEMRDASPELHAVIGMGSTALDMHRKDSLGLRRLAEVAQESMTRVAWAMRLAVAEERSCLSHIGTEASVMTLVQAEIAAGIRGLDGTRAGVWKALDMAGEGA